MALILDGTLGVTTPAESVTGTGVWSVGGSQIYKDALGNVGIGTSSPAGKLNVAGGGVPNILSTSTGGITVSMSAVDPFGGGFIGTVSNHPQMFYTNNAERARIDSAGNVGIGTSSPTQKLSVAGSLNVSFGQLITGATAVYSDGTIGTPSLQTNAVAGSNVGAVGIANTTGSIGQYAFRNPNGLVGQISTSGSTTAYVTSSDYRLKNAIAPMTGALDKVALLKPCTYKWNADGSDGQGFIAHELQAVEPGCVTGEKDAVDAEGKPQFQGIDTSFLVATLTAAIQEQQAIIQSLTTRITALEAK